MKLRTHYLPLITLLLLFLIPTLHAAAPPPTGAVQLTQGAALERLERWPGTESVAHATPHTLAIDVEFTTHTLLIDGTPILTTTHEILGRPTLAPDGRWLVLARIPRGNESARLGELWRYDLDDGSWLQLTRNGVPESSPVISPDGSRVAFLREGDIWSIPATHLTTEALATPPPAIHPARAANPPALLEPPATIRVKHLAASNNCRPGVPDGQIDLIPFEEYLRHVTPYESPPSWHIETLKAQAVAARSYAWRQILMAQDNPAQPYDVTDTTQHQYMCDGTHPNTDLAVEATRGQYLEYDDKPIFAMYSAENASPTKDGDYYLDAVVDPLSFGQRRYGHGFGFSQWGGKRWADAGWSYVQILRHYYPNAVLYPSAGDLTTTVLDVVERPVTDWLRGAAIGVELNASNVRGTRAREWWTLDGTTWQVGPWQEDGSGVDGWHHFFDLQPRPELPQGNYRIEYTPAESGHAPTGPLPVLYLGIDRTPPTLSSTLTVQEPDPTSGARAATLQLLAQDTLSGVERVGWSQAAWQREGEALGAGAGTLLVEGGASRGEALRWAPGSSAAHPFAFPAIAVEPAHYRLWLRLRTPDISHSARVATVRLFDDAGTPLQRGVRHLHAWEFPSTGWEWFYLDVDATAEYTAANPGSNGYPAASLLPVIEWYGGQTLDVDLLFLATRAAPDAPPLTFGLPGPVEVTTYATDQASNVVLNRCLPSGRRGAAIVPRAALPHHIFLPLTPSGSAPPPDGPYHCEAWQP